MLVFDIETGARPEAELRPLCPPFDPSTVKGIVEGEFDPASVRGVVTGEFDPASVKLGRMTDQAKIDAKIAESRAAHVQAVADSGQLIIHARAEFERAKANNATLLAEAEAAHWQAFVNNAAKSARTGQILAIGYYSPASKKHGIQGQGETLTEAQLLTNFWNKYRACRSERRRLIGHFSNKFDVPFVARRSWLLGVEVPETLFEQGRYLDRTFVDLMQHWQCGDHREWISLHDLAQYLGVGGKPEGITGADFGRLWQEDRATAIAYLKNDLEITAACAAKMGFV